MIQKLKFSLTLFFLACDDPFLNVAMAMNGRLSYQVDLMHVSRVTWNTLGWLWIFLIRDFTRAFAKVNVKKTTVIWTRLLELLSRDVNNQPILTSIFTVPGIHKRLHMLINFDDRTRAGNLTGYTFKPFQSSHLVPTRII